MSVSYNPSATRMDNCVLFLDAANPKSWSQNVIPNPIDIFGWMGTASINLGTAIRDTSVTDSPVKGTPLKLTSTGTDCYTNTYNNSTWNLAPAAAGQTWTISFYAKAQAATTGNCFLFSANSSGVYIDAPSTSFSITTSWQRFSFSAALSSVSTAYVQCRLGCSVNGGVIWFDGLQVELASATTTFNPKVNSNRANLNSQTTTPIVATTYGAVPYSTDGNGCFDFATATGSPSSLGFTFSANMVPRVGNFAFSCWTKGGPAGPGQVTLFSNAGGAEGYRFGTSQTGAYVLCGMPYNEAGITWAAWDNTKWHHVIAVYDRIGIDTGTPRVAVYLDGVYQGAMALVAQQLQMADVTPGIVRNPGVGWTGKLAIFAVYAGHITSTEVTSLFNTHRARFGV